MATSKIVKIKKGGSSNGCKLPSNPSHLLSAGVRERLETLMENVSLVMRQIKSTYKIIITIRLFV